MISRIHRFHGYNALRFVYGRGQTVRGQLTTLKYVRNPRRSSYRAAVVVGRKVHRSAVVRNRIRRRIYEIIRSHEAAITEPYDLVMTVYSDQVAELEAAKLHKMITALLTKAGVLSGPTGGAAAAGHAIVEPKERT